VFARLLLQKPEEETKEGDKQQLRYEGLHGFLVRIRNHDEKRSVAEGCKVWDMGYKIGLNGIDNAALHFHNVRIPRSHLLNATSMVSPEGAFSSKVDDRSTRRRKRFLVLADQLLSGRVCIASMVLGSTKMTLATTIRYAYSRKAVGPNGYSTAPILGFQLTKNALMPMIATTYANNFALKYVQRRYAEQTDDDKSHVVILCCAIKPLITWHASYIANVCRERCGGQGFLAANRFGEAIVGAHAGITAEGDNKVIQQKVSKELMAKVTKTQLMRHYAFIHLPHSLQRTYNYHSGAVEDLAWLQRLFEWSENRAIADLAVAMYQRSSRGGKGQDNNPLYDAWMLHESTRVQRVADAFGERVRFEAFHNVLKSQRMLKENKGKQQQSNNGDLVAVLTKLCLLHGLTILQENVGYFLTEGVISIYQARESKHKIEELCKELGKPETALRLVESFGIPEWMHHAPIAQNWKKYNEVENNGELVRNQSYRDANRLLTLRAKL